MEMPDRSNKKGKTHFMGRIRKPAPKSIEKQRKREKGGGGGATRSLH